MADSEEKIVDGIGLTAIVICSFTAGALKGHADKKGIPIDPLCSVAAIAGPTVANGFSGVMVGTAYESSVGKRAAIYATTAAVCTAAGYFVGNTFG